MDSERAAAKLLRRALSVCISEVSLSSAGLTPEAKKEIAVKLLERVQAQQSAFGLSFECVEVRKSNSRT